MSAHELVAVGSQAEQDFLRAREEYKDARWHARGWRALGVFLGSAGVSLSVLSPQSDLGWEFGCAIGGVLTTVFLETEVHERKLQAAQHEQSMDAIAPLLYTET